MFAGRESELQELTEQLMTAHQLIYERGGKSLANGSRIHEFAFKHNLIREYVYQHLPKTKRELLHVKIGDCLERLYAPNADEIAAQLAVHFYHGYVPEKAVSYGLKAAQDANARYGAAEAVRFAKMGLEALETRKAALPPNEYAETKIRLLLELAKAEEDGGDPQEQKDHIKAGIKCFEENLILLDSISENLQANFYNTLGALYRRKGPKFAKESQKYLEKALFFYEKYDDKRNIIETLFLLTDGSVWPSISPSIEEPNPEEKCIKASEKALLIAEELQDIPLKIQWLARLGSYKNFSVQKQYVLQAFELWREYDNPNKPHGILESVRGIYEGYAKYKTGMKYLHKALEFSKRKGNLMWESWIIYLIGRSLGCYITLQDEAFSALEKSLAIRERIGYRKSAILSLLGMKLLKQGKWRDAEKSFQKAMNDSSGENRYGLWLLELLRNKISCIK